MHLRRSLTAAIAVVMVGVLLPIAAPGLASASAEPTELDAVRVASVTELVAGFEHYRAVQGSYPSQGGFRDEGRGSVYVNSSTPGASSYGVGSVTEILNSVDADVSETPAPPLRLWEVVAQPCNGRVAIMSGSDGITTDPADAQWWADNNCPTWYLNNGRPYFQLTEAVTGATARDTDRIDTVTDLVDAFEAYENTSGNYEITGGRNNSGAGSVYVNSSVYSSYGARSVTETLNDLGITIDTAPASSLRLWEVVAQPCNGRVAIMSGADAITTDPADAQWWADNGCNTWYLNNGRPYFQLTDEASGMTELDTVRVDTVTELVAAFEAFALANGRYEITAGSGDSGKGSVYPNRGLHRSYGAQSIVEALNETSGVAVATAPTKPLKLWEIAALPCKGRVAILSGSDNITTDAADAQWWADNDCPTWYLNNGRPYFQLTRTMQELPPLLMTAVFGGMVRINARSNEAGHTTVDGFRLYNENGVEVESRVADEGAIFFVDSDVAAVNTEFTYSMRSYTGDQLSDPAFVTFTVPMPVPQVVKVDYDAGATLDIAVKAQGGVDSYQLSDPAGNVVFESVEFGDEAILEITRSYLDVGRSYTYNVQAVIDGVVSHPRGVRVHVEDLLAPAGPAVSLGTGNDNLVAIEATASTAVDEYRLYNEVGFKVQSLEAAAGSTEFVVGPESLTPGVEYEYSVRTVTDGVVSKSTSTTFEAPAVSASGAITCNGLTATVLLAEGDVPTDGNDVIVGTANDDVIDAGLGHDVVCGLGGNDVINGEGGNDTIFGGTGDDTIAGGDGIDQLYGHDGADIMNGGAEGDFLSGGAGDDEMYGDAGDDTMVGDAGNDIMWGRDGNDLMYGNDGNDRMGGDAGADTLRGGEGIDQLGGGADVSFPDDAVHSGIADFINRDDLDPGPGNVGDAKIRYIAPLTADGSGPASPGERFVYPEPAELLLDADLREAAGIQGVILDCWYN